MVYQKVKNECGEYFVCWVDQTPVFNSNITMGKKLSETGATNLINLLEEEGICHCQAITVQG